MTERPDPEKFIAVMTKIPRVPLPPNDIRPDIRTERLLLRALRQDDLQDLHILCQQEGVMKWTALGRTNVNLGETQERLSQFLPPNDTKTLKYAICLGETGEFIGIGGCSELQGLFGWPDIGYMFKQEAWGKGYATEFVRAFLEIYSGLPREQTEIRVDPRSVAGEGAVVEERYLAIVLEGNEKSQKILTKCGFEYFLTFQGRRGVITTFRYFPGRKPS